MFKLLQVDLYKIQNLSPATPLHIKIYLTVKCIVQNLSHPVWCKICPTLYGAKSVPPCKVYSAKSVPPCKVYSAKSFPFRMVQNLSHPVWCKICPTLYGANPPWCKICLTMYGVKYVSPCTVQNLSHSVQCKICPIL